MKTFEEAVAIVHRLVQVRLVREPRWRELKKYICPYRGIFDENYTDNQTRNQMLRFTSPGAMATLRAASGMTSGMTPIGGPWFKPDFANPEMKELSGVRQWLDELDRLMKDCLANGGFYQAIQTFNLDLIWSGCALLYSEASEDNTLRYECPQIGTFFVANDREGRLAYVARHSAFTAQDLEKAFGKAKMSRRAQEMLKHNRLETIKVWHLVCNNDKNGPHNVSSLWWEDGGEEFLKTGGYYEMPFFFSCWHEGVLPYGTGPGDDALPDAMQSDKLERHKLSGMAKIIDPPVQAPTHLKGHVQLTPGAINFVPENSQILPILDLSNYASALPHLREELMELRTRISDTMQATIFNSMPLDQRPKDMSATEFLERKRETLQQLGPVISAYEPNVLTPMLFRTLQALHRKGETPIPPDTLAGQDLLLKIDFISPMANALRQTGAETTRALFQDVAGMAGATQQIEILDKIDMDQMVDELANGLGAPGKVIRADSDVALIRQQRQMQQMAMQQMAIQQQQAETHATQAGAMADQAGAAKAMAEMQAAGIDGNTTGWE